MPGSARKTPGQIAKGRQGHRREQCSVQEAAFELRLDGQEELGILEKATTRQGGSP